MLYGEIYYCRKKELTHGGGLDLRRVYPMTGAVWRSLRQSMHTKSRDNLCKAEFFLCESAEEP